MRLAGATFDESDYLASLNSTVLVKISIVRPEAYNGAVQKVPEQVF